MNFFFSKYIEKKHIVLNICGLKFKLRTDTIFFKEKYHDIGIISFNMNTNLSNFGAALHSFAFQKYLNKKGINSVIINYRRNLGTWAEYKPKFQQILSERKYEEFWTNLKIFTNIICKKRKFDKFFKKNCVITKYQYDVESLKQLKDINRFVCETDVTWAKFEYGYDKGFLCDLPNMKTKDNIAYSIDFGSKEISEKNKVSLKKYAQNFKYISIRNVFKLDYFKKIIDRDDVVLAIDPVFLLDKEDYMKITKKIKMKEDYVLVYNCKENHPEMLIQAKKYANDNNLKLIIVNCYDKNILFLDKNNPTPIGIEEFLGYINSCKCFFTNSYHGLCFAIIYETPFYAFSRTGNGEKILTILEIFNLYNRFVEREIKPNEIDWNEVKVRWLTWRKKSEEFIYKSIIQNLK